MFDKFIFPWGVYIGDLENDLEKTPMMLDSKKGGFIVLFDDESEKTSANLIETIALNLLNIMPLNSLKLKIFDFGKKRFLYLSELEKINLYDISYKADSARDMYEEMEDYILKRYHDCITHETQDLNTYNEKYNKQEEFYLMIINLEDFPDNLIESKKIEDFIDPAYINGVYVIAFGNKKILENKNESTKSVLNRFPHLTITQSDIEFSENIFEHRELLELSDFKILETDKNILLKNIFNKYNELEQLSNEKDFLIIPIGKIGNDVFNFRMGLRSQNYHAFIAGMTGMGKTTLLNIIIVEIAKKYTSKEIELYLMDYKPAGAEFGIFKNHPNCRKLFLNNKDLEPALEMLQYFQDEMYERGKILNGMSIDEYNAKNPDNILSRKILIIDEVQRMFDGDWKEADKFNSLLEDIVKTGRSFGLHIILTTQSLKQINMKDSIMGQIPLKISFRLNDEIEAMKIFNNNKEAIKEVVKLPKYHFVYSDFYNTNVVKSDYLPKEKISDILEKIKNERKEGEFIVPEVVSVFSEKNENENLEETQNIPEYQTPYSMDEFKEIIRKTKKDS